MSDLEITIWIAGAALVVGLWLGWELGYRDYRRITAKVLLKSGRR